MKKNTKLLSALLAASLCLGLLAGCGSSASTTSAATGTSATADTSAAAETSASEAPAAQSEDAAIESAETQVETSDAAVNSTVDTATFTTVKDGVLTMGTNAAFPPYEYYDGDAIVGIDAEIAQAIADKLGLTLQIEDMEFDSIITAVSTGKVDMGLAGMTVTEDRLKNINFSNSYATGVQSVIVSADSNIASIDDLAGKKIGVQLGTTGDIYACDDFGTDNVEQYNKGNDAVLALVQGKIDAVIIDDAPARSYVAANTGLTILDTEYAVEDYAACIAKDNDALLSAINDALAALKEDGTLQSIIDKYITTES